MAQITKISGALEKQIDAAVVAFKQRRTDFETDAKILETRLRDHIDLKRFIHSMKWRAKDPEHLRDKLRRKAIKALNEKRKFAITSENVLSHIKDLAGVRLIHLHLRQMEKIHPLLMRVFEEEGYVVVGRPEAKTWDPEYARMFDELELKVERNESLYTSVHYIIKQNRKSKRHCELQVRTLAEEIWGEVSHTINYPHETDSLACKEQLKVLARLVSGCSRLVDSIVASSEDHEHEKKRKTS